MANYSNNGIAPCVKAKPYKIGETRIDYDVLYSIKAVREMPEKCVECQNSSCECCEYYYYDFVLPCLKKVKQEAIDNWIVKNEEKDNDLIYYYYKYFFANIFGRLIINKYGIVIEVLSGCSDDESSDVVETIVESYFDPIVECSEYLSSKQLEDLHCYASNLSEQNKLMLQCNNSLIFNFAFTTINYFDGDEQLEKYFEKTNLLFYGMRSYPYIREINFYNPSALLF